jgi:leader peptidase (prepilin peptidase)/N-methyltransferase
VTWIVLYLPLLVALVVLAAIDLDRRLLPNRIVYPLAAWGAAATLVLERDQIAEHLLAGTGTFLFLYLAALANPAGLGMGDVKLAGVLGLYLGLAVIPALVVALLGGALAGVGMMFRDGAAALKRTLPFGVFLAFGALVSVLAGGELIELYRSWTAAPHE